MRDRDTTLDLPDDELRTLFDGALALAERELEATRSGPIYSTPPSAGQFDDLLTELPHEGMPASELLDDCSALLERSRRTSPAFFGYVLSPASPVGIAAAQAEMI